MCGYQQLTCWGGRNSIIVLHSSDLTDEDKDQIRFAVKNASDANGAKISVSFIEMKTEYDGSYEVRGISKCTYYRLSLPWLLPQYDKALYLDGDLIVNSPIDILDKFELGDNYIAGVKIPFHVANKRNLTYLSRMGFSSNEYVNAGVLLLNLKLMRKEGLDKEFSSHVKLKYLYQDQDILNKVCKGRIAHLPMKYNYTNGADKVDITEFSSKTQTPQAEIIEAIENPAIIHFNGVKPWKAIVPYWALWMKYFRQTSMYNPDDEEKLIRETINPKYSVKQYFKLGLKLYCPRLYRLISKR